MLTTKLLTSASILAGSSVSPGVTGAKVAISLVVGLFRSTVRLLDECQEFNLAIGEALDYEMRRREGKEIVALD